VGNTEVKKTEVVAVIKQRLTPCCANVPPAPPGFIEPCLPSKATKPPTAGAWIHEIKYDGFDGNQHRTFTDTVAAHQLLFGDVQRFALLIAALIAAV
jgi:hypothetical protein